ncbi:MAG: HD domain-containing protein [Alphaproteobacteria bacterium]|nr:HD domain-containing protein [Alphaproteobacteria bacterium]
MSGNAANNYQKSAGLVKSPLGGYVQFNTDSKFENMLLKIIGQREFQRMRNIGQLGSVGNLYAGARNSRFEHCIGTGDLMGHMLLSADINKSISASEDFGWIAHCDRHYFKSQMSPDKEFDIEQQATITAAFLHDIGHTYPGHLFENAIQAVPIENYKNHEKWGIEIIRRSEIYNILNSYSAGFAERVIKILSEDNLKNDVHQNILGGNLNADTLDYIWRDQEITGFNAMFSQQLMIELINGIRFIKIPTGGTGIALIDTIPEMLFTQMLSARAELYQNVYYNSQHAAAWAFMPKFFKGIRAALDHPKYKSDIKNTNNPFVKFIESLGTDYDAYLKLDNYGFFQMMHSISSLGIPGLSDLAERYTDPTAGFTGEEIYSGRSEYAPNKSYISAQKQEVESQGGILDETIIPWYKPSKGEVYCIRGPNKFIKFSEQYKATANNKSVIISKFFMNEM